MKCKRTVLFSDYTVPAATADQKEACTQSVTREAGRIVRGQSLLHQIRTQLAYIGPWFFIGLTGILAAMILALLDIQSQPATPADSTVPVLAMFGIVGPCVACLSVPVLARSHANGMWELEETAFYNLPRLASIRLLICALAALPVLVVLAVVGLGAAGTPHGLTALLAPFFLINGINYFILGRLRGMAGSLCCIGAGFLLAVAAVSLSSRAGHLTKSLPEDAAVLSYFIICACALFFLLSARRYIIQSSMTQRKETVYGNDF